jgi:hypothetical protein
MDVRGEIIGQGDVARNVPGTELRAVALRRHRVDLILERGPGGTASGLCCQQRSDVVRRRDEIILAVMDADDRIVEARLLVIIDAKAWLDVESVRHSPVELAEHCEAGVVEIDRVGGRKAIENIGIGRIRTRQ